MPSGRTHDRLTLLTAPISAIAAYSATASPIIALSSGMAHIIGGYLLSPDIDLWQSRPTKRWRSVGLGFVWRGYCDLFKHRGISHTPIIGTVSRLAWLGLWIAPIWWAFRLPVPRINEWMVWVGVAIEFSAAVHYCADLLWSAIKKAP